MLSVRAQAVVAQEYERATRSSRFEFESTPIAADGSTTVRATWTHDTIDVERLRARLAELGPGHVVVLECRQ